MWSVDCFNLVTCAVDCVVSRTATICLLVIWWLGFGTGEEEFWMCDSFWSLPVRLMSDSWQMRIWEGWWLPTSCMLFGGCGVRVFMRRPRCTWDWKGHCLRMIGKLLAPSASRVCPLLHYASDSNLQRVFLTDERQRSRSEASCCHDWWLIPACASCLSFFSWSVSEHHDRGFLLGARRRRLHWACVCLPFLRRGQLSAAAPEARWSICWAGWFSRGLLPKNMKQSWLPAFWKKNPKHTRD